MKFLLILISLSVVPIFSLSNIFSKSKKLCTNCKHFIKPAGPKQVGKCSLFPILNDMDTDTEEEMDDKHFLDCIRSRKIYYMCGEKGRYFEKVVPVEYPPFLSLVDPTFFDEISEFDFEQYIQFL
jgi:hypothetical protein